FGNCSSLQTIRIPYLIDYLNNDLFAGCDSLRMAILANPYTEIEDGTFSEKVEIIFDNPTDKSV
ncbi:MAG: leucine-rich repeat protein, partial [Bacteroidales bacterium]|nr:leucine-rich repeat protein [Bacteroidales bacterium]